MQKTKKGRKERKISKPGKTKRRKSRENEKLLNRNDNKEVIRLQKIIWATSDRKEERNENKIKQERRKGEKP